MEAKSPAAVGDTLTVNALPVTTLSTAFLVQKNAAATAVAGVSIADPDAGSANEVMTVKFTS